MSIAPLNWIPRAVHHERRNARRISLSLPVEAELGGGRKVVQLVELSRTGARIVLADAPVGAGVVIRRAGIESAGAIVWADDGQAGIHFREALGERDFIQLRRRIVA